MSRPMVMVVLAVSTWCWPAAAVACEACLSGGSSASSAALQWAIFVLLAVVVLVQVTVFRFFRRVARAGGPSPKSPAPKDPLGKRPVDNERLVRETG